MYTHLTVLYIVNTLTACSFPLWDIVCLWAACALGLYPFSCICMCGWSEMASTAGWSPGQSLLAACVNFMDYTEPGNKLLWFYQKSILACISGLCHRYSIKQQQMHFECIFCQVKLQIYPFLSLCVITYRIIAFKFLKEKNPPNISHNRFEIIPIIFLMYVLSSVYFMNCTVYFYSWLLEIFSCHLIIKVCTGKFQCRFYCVFFT